MKPLTAETAETAEKKMLRILGELCVLCGKTSHFFTRSLAGPVRAISQTFEPRHLGNFCNPAVAFMQKFEENRSACIWLRGRLK